MEGITDLSLGRGVKAYNIDPEAGRYPICIIVDTCKKMVETVALVKEFIYDSINSFSSSLSLSEKMDLEMITFNTEEQIPIKIPAQEFYKLIDESTGYLSSEYEKKLDFKCAGRAPIAYALRVAVDYLRERYYDLKNMGKSPRSPILFVFTSGLTDVYSYHQEEHDRLLIEEVDRIKLLVREYRLCVFVIKCIKIEYGQKNMIKDTLFMDITGRDDSTYVFEMQKPINLFDILRLKFKLY